MKRLTKKPWFGPRTFGWGWQPITWEGWVSFLALVAPVLYIIKKNPTDPNKVFYILIFVVIFSLLCYLTGGKPGSKLFKKKNK